MKRYREIYRAGQLPVSQNRMFHSEQEAKNCIKGDVVLGQDLETERVNRFGTSGCIELLSKVRDLWWRRLSPVWVDCSRRQTMQRSSIHE